ncbi:MAG TPA: hypothetical protein VLB84_03005, partial [Bacteroidia bacterium]|nr:hypothetical protein [Bacteroidia bacterium]
MNNARQHHIRSYQHTRTETATAIAPPVGRFFKMDAKTKGCKSGSKRQAEIRTGCNATDGILMCTFLPKLRAIQ